MGALVDKERMSIKQVKADGGGTEVEPPKQNTDIIRVNRPLVSDYQDLQADWVVRIMQMSSPAKITCKFMELFTSPMMPTNETDKLFKSIDRDGWVTVEGNLVDAEYEKLFGKKWWPSIKEKHKTTSYLAYDNTKPKDEIGLYPEFQFYFPKGLKIKFNMTSYADDSNADVSYEVIEL